MRFTSSSPSDSPSWFIKMHGRNRGHGMMKASGEGEKQAGSETGNERHQNEAGGGKAARTSKTDKIELTES